MQWSVQKGDTEYIAEETMGLIDRICAFLGVNQGDDKSATMMNQNILLAYVVLVLSVGSIAILLYALQANTFWAGATIFGIGIMFAGASFLVGNLIGFLFGIPRALRQSFPDTPQSAGSSESQSAINHPSYSTNTNLEQISDWLTKILVGVGLTQLSEISRNVNAMAVDMGKALGALDGNCTGNTAFAGAIIVYFVIFGFLVCYLWTRLYLQRALDDPVALLSDKIQQAQRDAEALAIIDRQLDRALDAKAVDQKVLSEAIKKASTFVKAQIFTRAQTVRSLNWENQKLIMERTIPIFIALIEDDTEKRYHRNHAQLGFALKDQCKPDYAKAKEALTTAINRRGPWEDEGWVIYEFNRAVCTIKLDPKFNLKLPSDIKIKEEILADLKASSSSEWIQTILVEEPSVREWMHLNNVNPDSL